MHGRHVVFQGQEESLARRRGSSVRRPALDVTELEDRSVPGTALGTADAVPAPAVAAAETGISFAPVATGVGATTSSPDPVPPAELLGEALPTPDFDPTLIFAAVVATETPVRNAVGTPTTSSSGGVVSTGANGSTTPFPDEALPGGDQRRSDRQRHRQRNHATHRGRDQSHRSHRRDFARRPGGTSDPGPEATAFLKYLNSNTKSNANVGEAIDGKFSPLEIQRAPGRERRARAGTSARTIPPPR